MTARILVLDANQRSALAITRSLGRGSEITVLTSDDTRTSLAGASRFSSRYLRSPSSTMQPDAFVEWLIQTRETEEITHIFPATEVSSYTCLMHRQRLAPSKIPFAALDTIHNVANKCRLIRLAKELDIPHPRSRHVEHSEEFDPTTIDHYPVVLKPCYSKIWLDGAWLTSSVHTAHSKEELTQLIGSRSYLSHHPFLIQEFIPGTGAGVFALYSRGRAETFFSHRRLREKPPSGGVSVLCESAAPNPELVEMARRLLDRVKWHGVAMTEFRITPNGKPYLMEVNPRFWGSLQLAIDCGIDFPRLLFEVCEGREPHTPAEYPVGRRLRWLLGDLDSLYLFLRDKKHYTTQQKLRRALEFLRPGIGRTNHEINRLNDLRPAWYECVQYVRDILTLESKAI